jgi:hypothetical protein
MAGTPGILSETGDPLPNPSAHWHEHGPGDQQARDTSNRGIARPETASARLLRSINAFPSSIDELAIMPVDLVGRAIAYAQSEPGIESIPGWVVEALRRHRDEGWPIPPLRTRQIGLATRDHPIDVETYTSGAYGDLFRLGSDTTDLEDSQLDSAEVALVPTGIGAMAHTPAELVVQSEQFVDIPDVSDAAQAPADPIQQPELANDALTQHVQEELRIRCGRLRSRLIAGLRIQVASGTTLIICATFEDLAIVQHELLGALQRILMGIGAPPQLVFTTRAGWEARRTEAGNVHSRPVPTTGIPSLS